MPHPVARFASSLHFPTFSSEILASRGDFAILSLTGCVIWLEPYQ